MLKGTRFFAGFVALLTMALSPAVFPETEPELAWRENQSVDARVQNVPVKKLLSRLATVTGWKIYAEPELDKSVSVSFKNLPQGQALRLLLGDLNYALVPAGGEPAKL